MDEGGSRNDPGPNRYGCFLPDLTGLATAPSARLPGRIWAMIDLCASDRCAGTFPQVDKVDPANKGNCSAQERAGAERGLLGERRGESPDHAAIQTYCDTVGQRSFHDPAEAGTAVGRPRLQSLL